MKLKSRLLRKLAEKKIIEWDNDYFTNDEKQQYEALQEELCKLEVGEEIEPPWVKYSNTLSPWELRNDYWLINIWLVSWRKMSAEDRTAYQKDWDMPDDWYDVVTMFWTDNN